MVHSGLKASIPTEQEDAMTTPVEVIRKIASVSVAVGFQAGVPGSDVAGMIVSFLYANPEHVERFMREGSELFVDGTIRPAHGSLTYLAANGEVLDPAELRRRTGLHDQ